MSSVLLLSGGFDSAANLALAYESGQAPMLALTANYGQRAAAAEIRAARGLAEYYGVPHRVVEIPWLGGMGGSALTDSALSIPTLRSDQLDDAAVTRESARSVWVPNRNGVLLEIAAAFAEAAGATSVLAGFNREEGATFPDNTRAFMDALSGSLRFSTANSVRVESLTVDWDKREIAQAVARCRRKPFAWDWVWSCYTAGPQACGVCESCGRLARARTNSGL